MPVSIIEKLKIKLWYEACKIFSGLPYYLQSQMDICDFARDHEPSFVDGNGGFFVKNDPVERKIINLDPWDNTRRDILILLLRTIIFNKIEGELAELGVYRGLTAKLIHHYVPDRKLHLFDTFTGFDKRDVSVEMNVTQWDVNEDDFSDTSLEKVQKYIAPLNNNTEFHQGYFPESIPKTFGEKRFAFVHLDADMYSPIIQGLEFFYKRLSPGGIIVVHDYNAWLGARKAVDDFCVDLPIYPMPLPDKSGSALINKPKFKN
jgi:O-methyltransferase